MIRNTVIVLGVSVAVAVVSGVGYGLTKKPGEHIGHKGNWCGPCLGFGNDGFRVNLSDSDGPAVGTGPVQSRDFAWSGDHLEFSAPGDLTLHQGPTAKLTVSGPADLLDKVEVDDGVIGLKRGDYNIKQGLTFDLTAPDIDHIDMSGMGHMQVVGYDQPSLTADMSGVGLLDIAGKTNDLSIKLDGTGGLSFNGFTAKTIKSDLSGLGKLTFAGQADSLDIDLSGAGAADFGALKVKDVTLDLSGLGMVTLAPTASADLDVSGAGKVKLLTKPPKLITRTSGLGKID